jgi:acylpyruvate hydrolase
MRLGTLAAPSSGGTQAVVITRDGAIPVRGYRDIGALLSAGESGWQAARRAESDGEAQPFEDARLLRPVLDPPGIVCVGLNYATHIKEMGRELPTSPTLFAKLPRALTDPYADVVLPPPSRQVDYEGELAVIIGRRGRYVRAADAADHIAGLTVLNDVTARDYQRRTLQWFAGKTFQESTPMGPWIVTLDELGDLSELELRLSVNGEQRQRAALGDLVFDIAALVADISQIVELLPGDVIATGTPGGVGEAADTFLADGDTVEVAIDGIGVLRNRFVTTKEPSS